MLSVKAESLKPSPCQRKGENNMPIHESKLEETKKYYTQKDFEDGKCDENGKPVVPGVAASQEASVDESKTDPDPKPEKGKSKKESK